MQYMGGKAKAGKQIAAYMGKWLFHNPGKTTYLDPFCGACHVAQYTAWMKTCILADRHPDLILLWKALQHLGWRPPVATISRELWEELRKAEHPSPLRAFAGFGCSFGDRFFEGYAANKRKDDFTKAALWSLLAIYKKVKKAQFFQSDYRKHKVDSTYVIYCDPPYEGTKCYTGLGKFRSARFWQQARHWVRRGATVFVSEYNAPDDFKCVLEIKQKGTLHHKENDREFVERLFMHEDQA